MHARGPAFIRMCVGVRMRSKVRSAKIACSGADSADRPAGARPAVCDWREAMQPLHLLPFPASAGTASRPAHSAAQVAPIPA
eukprot:364639-Chlamydomonas_euryale.AAC.58